MRKGKYTVFRLSTDSVAQVPGARVLPATTGDPVTNLNKFSSLSGLLKCSRIEQPVQILKGAAIWKHCWINETSLLS